MSITVVSGLPRSGTSLLMQMLDAAGLPVLTDGIRESDANNPKGYFEWERVKRLPREPYLIAEAEGKAVKVISLLLSSLPRGFDYKVLFLERGIAEVTRSQSTMISILGAADPNPSKEQMESALAAHRRQINSWFAARPEIALLRVSHRKLLTEAGDECAAIARFLDLDAEASKKMERVIDPALWRQRS